MPDIRLVPMDKDNVASVAAVELNCFTCPWSLSSFISELGNPLAVYRVAFWDGVLAGYIGMHHIIDEGHIMNVAVLPNLRRKGIAAAMVEAMLAYARENGLRMVTLEVRASNAAAIRLYEQYGFVPVGLRKDYYPEPVEDAVLMTVEL